MRTITIFKKTENRTVKNEIIHNMQPDDMQRKLSGSISRELIPDMKCWYHVLLKFSVLMIMM